MSAVSCNRPPLFDDDQYLDSHSPFESTEFESSTNTPVMEDTPCPTIIVITADDGDVDTAAVMDDLGGGTKR